MTRNRDGRSDPTHPAPIRIAALALLGILGGCASAGSHQAGSTLNPATSDRTRDIQADGNAKDGSSATPDTIGSLSLQEYREVCRTPSEEELVEEVSRVLQETSCSAVLWVDGIFGDQRDVIGARRTSGTIQVSTLYSQFAGVDPGGRVRLRYDLPNLERRANLFLGRGDEQQAVEDREERFSLRSSLPAAESERWIAGMGLVPPGRWEENADVRIGVRPSTSPALFIQGRTRQQISAGDWAEWRFRQTLFWETRQGLGATVEARYQHLLEPHLLLHWNVSGTLSEESHGVEWRVEPSVYRRLANGRVVGAQPFSRGATSADVPLQEYGIRGVYRHPLRQPSLAGEFVAGYSWPREDPGVPRSGSISVGIQLELRFGREPVGLQ